MVAYACAYALVAAALLAYSRLTGGRYADFTDLMLDVVFCAIWPLSLGFLALGWLCGALLRRTEAGRRE